MENQTAKQSLPIILYLSIVALTAFLAPRETGTCSIAQNTIPGKTCDTLSFSSYLPSWAMQTPNRKWVGLDVAEDLGRKLITWQRR